MDLRRQPSSVLALSPTFLRAQTNLSSGTTFYYPDPTAEPLYRLHTPPYTVARISDVCGSLSVPTPEGPFPCCQGLFGLMAIYFSIHACVKDNL
jgi:hypothetical protein